MRARLHLVHMLCGAVIGILLGIHMVVLHFDAILGTAEPTGWTSVIERSSQGIWVGVYIALLGLAIYHALYGLRNIILEATTSPKAGPALTWSFTIIGLVAFVWGAYVPIALLAS
jgi:succinate dehydrogenase hydrophobic anchor subunit